MNYRHFKRPLDFLLAAIAALVFLPIVLVVAVVVGWNMGTPVLFVQVRPGMRGRPFRMLKFRTMREAFNRRGEILSDDQRLTPLGKFLRNSSLDELPELWNVLRGEMSIVGPRPLLMEYLPLYTADQARRHEVRPGITGWAQVNGRNAISWEQKFEYDVWYVDHRSFWLDMKILWMTAIRVLRREGVSQQGHVTMERFTGSGHG